MNEIAYDFNLNDYLTTLDSYFPCYIFLSWTWDRKMHIHFLLAYLFVFLNKGDILIVYKLLSFISLWKLEYRYKPYIWKK